MAKALGIAAFVILLLSVPIPFVGTYVTFLALVIATAAELTGETIFTLVTVVVSAVKVFFLSPSWHFAMFGAAYMQGVNSAVLGAAHSGLSRYGDAGTNQLIASGQSGMEQSVQAAQASGAFNIVMTVAFLAAPIVGLLVRRMMARGSAPRRQRKPATPLAL